MPRNPRPASRGIGGRHAAESGADIRRNTQHWAEVIADVVISDAIRDRLEHAALTIDITGESYRGVKARKLASKKHGA